MMRGRADENQKKRLVTLILALVIFCGFLYVYSRKDGSSALEYGSKSLKKFGSSYWSGDDDADESSFKPGEDGEDAVMLKSIPVSFSRPLIITDSCTLMSN